ncbi:hypothetical protein [Marinisporobacter balticus]|uniref:Flagellar hook-length control protein FliK n=1 Tax=Marinisporobacter balticus TaxID=2018667 RepID=A0A4R2L406_9FIRM|nr:hypothetical protein [Marinisporobacter balticus]TCO79967.1 hypothetical protein EV214_101201 [Marinisporobacter balticus]
MRISQSNYNLQVQGNNEQGLIGFKTGQIMHAKIQKIINDVLFLEMANGKIVEAKTTIALDYQENAVLKFKVKEMNEKQITIQPIIENPDKEETTAPVEKKIINLLKTLDIKSGKEEITLVKQLLANEIPASKENLLKMIQIKSDFEKMESLLQDKTINMNEKILNENIRLVLKNLLKDGDVFKEKQSNVLFQNERSSSNKELMHTEIKKNGSNLTQEGTTRENTNLKNVNIHNVNFEKIIFLLKNNLSVNISNITNINNLILKDDTVGSKIDNLVELLYKNEETSNFGKNIDGLFLKIKHMILEKKFEPQEIMKEIYIKLELVKQGIGSLNPKNGEEILNNITNLKNSLDFINKMNQFQNYLQIPIFLDNEHKNLECFISKDDKNGKKINPKDVKILVALDTKTMDKVQVLIDIKDKNITCNFKVIADEVKQILLKFENQLKDALMFLGFTQVNTNYAVSNIEGNILGIDNDQNSKKINCIDVKV